jgi:hypothetical protein
MSEDNFDDFYDELDDFLNNNDHTSYFDKWLWESDKNKRRSLEIDLIESYYPGVNFLMDDELIRQKYFDSKHFFQHVIAIKRMLEDTGFGIAIPLPHGYRFCSGRGL